MNVQELEAAFVAEAKARKRAAIEKQFSSAALQSPILQLAIALEIEQDYGAALGEIMADQYSLQRGAELELKLAEELIAAAATEEEQSVSSAKAAAE